MFKLRVFATVAFCAAIVMGSAGMAGAKQNDKEKGQWKIGPGNSAVVEKGDYHDSEREWKGNHKAKVKKNVFKEGRLLIPVKAIEKGLGAKIILNLPDGIKIEKDGKFIEIDLVHNTAIVNGNVIDLRRGKNNNARIVISPGLINKLLTAAGCETLPSIVAEDISLVAGEEKEFAVSASNPQGSKAYDRVLFKYTIKNTTLSDIAAFQYKEGEVWKDMPLAQSGSDVVGYFGPSGGFPLPVSYSATTTFRLRMEKKGTYSAEIKLVDLNDNERTLAQDKSTITVYATEARITAEDLTLVADEVKVFTVSSVNPQGSWAYSKVLYKFTISNTSINNINAFRYKDGSTWKNMLLSQSGSNVVGYFGPSGGFPLPVNYSATATCSLNMDIEGTYRVKISLVDMNSGEQVIAQDYMTVTVN
ncbi:MAG: stalk domain-containing protein [Desulfocucumaceae bacterium]